MTSTVKRRSFLQMLVGAPAVVMLPKAKALEEIAVPKPHSVVGMAVETVWGTTPTGFATTFMPLSGFTCVTSMSNHGMPLRALTEEDLDKVHWKTYNPCPEGYPCRGCGAPLLRSAYKCQYCGRPR